MPWSIVPALVLKSFAPTWFIDWVQNLMGENSAMNTFKGRAAPPLKRVADEGSSEPQAENSEAGESRPNGDEEHKEVNRVSEINNKY